MRRSAAHPEADHGDPDACRRYQITDTGLQQAPLFTHARNHLLRTGLAQITDPDPPAPSRLRTADRAYRSAFNDLARYADLGGPEFSG